MTDKPSVSIVMATLNAERYLEECLGAVRAQDYPRDRVEIVLGDAASTDRTLEIARRFEVDTVVPNPLKTGEAGKAAALRAATGEIVVLLDSDNVVVGRDWLTRMVRPLVEDPELMAAEPRRWAYSRGDHFINRWHALSGVADPVVLFVGNYARESLITGRWTECPVRSEPRDGYERVELDPAFLPTLGANGYVVRRRAFDLVPVGDYLFDVDHAYELVLAGHRAIALVDAPVHHYFCDGARRFVRKTRRRIDDYHYFSAVGERSYPWQARQRRGVLRFVASTVTVLPLLVQAARGMRRRRDPAWLFHVAACWITLVVYALGTLRARRRPEMLDRTGWSQ